MTAEIDSNQDARVSFETIKETWNNFSEIICEDPIFFITTSIAITCLSLNIVYFSPPITTTIGIIALLESTSISIALFYQINKVIKKLSTTINYEFLKTRIVTPIIITLYEDEILGPFLNGLNSELSNVSSIVFTPFRAIGSLFNRAKNT